jgi:GrpB-like predicted nucleotidyltransferase (UPF0157 family)
LINAEQATWCKDLAMRRDPIHIEPYDSAWPALFAEQRDQIEPLLRPWLTQPIEHIGSTSVPGLAAKPIIDMLAVVDKYERFVSAIPLLEDVSWVLAPEPGDQDERKYSLCHPDIAQRSHHLHVVECLSTGWPTWLRFRDTLRTDPDAAAEYAALKRELAEADPHDRPAYRAAKAPFIQSVLTGARRAQP